MGLIEEFLRYFIPLFVAIDPLGLLPLFLAVTGGLAAAQRRRVVLEAVIAAFIICLSFMFLGHAVFGFLGISVADFRIAGGILLLVLAVLDLLSTGKPAVHETEMIGLVPLAMPLIAGPATLTTLLVLAQDGARQQAMTTAALLVNLALVLGVLLGANRLSTRMGLNALRAISKLVMVLLAAIAVNFIRTGIMDAWREMRDAP
jgi:multiple antibiotic resistance protein